MRVALVACACVLSTPAVAAPWQARVVQTLEADMNQPTDVAVGPEGRRYVLDGLNGRVVVFDRGGRYVRSFGRRGFGPGEMNKAVGIGIDPKAGNDAQIYVADTGNARVLVFSPQGAFTRVFALDAPTGGRRPRPTDVLPSASGVRLYVVDNGNHMVRIHLPQGDLIRTFGSRGEAIDEFRYPSTIAESAAGPIYVVDVLGARVLRFDGASARPSQVSGWGVGPGKLFRPKGVAVDGRGNVFVTDSFTGLVHVFDGLGRSVGSLDAGGKPLRLRTPTSLAFGPAGRLHVVETRPGRVRVLEVSGR